MDQLLNPRRPVRLALLPTLLACLLGPAGGHAQPVGDVQRGMNLFAEHCAECHSLKEGKHKKGPALLAVMGTTAGSQAGFAYSEAMKSSNWTWAPENLGRYLTQPKTALPGGKMKYDGMAQAQDRADVIAFLSAQSKRP